MRNLPEIPSAVTSRPWYRRKSTRAWTAGATALISAAIAIAQAVSVGIGVLFWAIVVVLLVAFFELVVTLLSARDEDAAEVQHHSPDGLRGCLHVLYMVLKLQYEQDPSNQTSEIAFDDLRVTIHKVVHENDEADSYLEQVTEYVGGGGGEVGRRLPIQTGLIGKVARSSKPLRAYNQAANSPAWRQELVEDWGFTEEQATQVRDDRRTYVGVPIKERKRNTTIGVVFVDSKFADFNSLERERLIIEASAGISEYIEERYS